MTTKHTFHALLISASLAALIGPVATAAPQRSRQDGSGVARISTAMGDVSKRHGQSGDLVSAESGMPLVGGDTIRTGVGGRAELRLDASNFLRLAPNSEVRLRQLGERAFEIDIIRGVVAYTMLKHGEADVDLRTQGGNIVPRKDGLYRIELTGPKESTLLVRKGEAEVLTPNHNTIVHKGKSVNIREDDPNARPMVVSAKSKDSFDDWNERRNRMLDDARGPIYGGGWYPSVIHAGWGWGYPYMGPWGFYGGYSPWVTYYRPRYYARRR